MSAIRVAIAGRSAAQCELIYQLLDRQPDLTLSMLTLDAASNDPLAALSVLPDILIAALDTDGEVVLRAIGSHRGRRPALIAIGPGTDPAMMRLAMQVGARDYFAMPIHADDLLQSVRSIQSEVQHAALSPVSGRARVVAVINAKGGSGASTIAANLAHVGTTHPSSREVALIDLDTQFGALPLMFDLRIQGALLNALESPDLVTPNSVRKYASQHRSGVSIFSAMSEQIPLPWELSASALNHLLETTRKSFGLVVVDLPRQIDPLTTVVLTQADAIVVVMQQSLVHVRDAKRLLRILTSTLAVPRDNITVVINRHTDRGALSDRDITEAIAPPRLAVLPNDYAAVLEAQNVGMPLLEQNRSSAISRALVRLLEQLTAGDASAQQDKRTGGLRAALKKAFRG